MQINQEIYKKANRIANEKDELKRYIRVCIKAGICPECGKNLKYSNTDAEGFWREENWVCIHCGWED